MSTETTAETSREVQVAIVPLNLIEVEDVGLGAAKFDIWLREVSGDLVNLERIKNVSGASITGELWTTLDPLDDWKPDAVLVVADMSGLLNYVGTSFEAWKAVPVYHYCPVEGDNLPALWKQVWDMFRPVAMSDYGARVIGEHIGRPVPRIYHGVDTETFAPVSQTDARLLAVAFPWSTSSESDGTAPVPASLRPA